MVSGSVLYSSINKTVKQVKNFNLLGHIFNFLKEMKKTAMVQSLSNLQVHNEILPVTAQVT